MTPANADRRTAGPNPEQVTRRPPKRDDAQSSARGRTKGTYLGTAMSTNCECRVRVAPLARRAPGLDAGCGRYDGRGSPPDVQGTTRLGRRSCMIAIERRISTGLMLPVVSRYGSSSDQTRMRPPGHDGRERRHEARLHQEALAAIAEDQHEQDGHDPAEPEDEPDRRRDHGVGLGQALAPACRPIVPELQEVREGGPFDGVAQPQPTGGLLQPRNPRVHRRAAARRRASAATPTRRPGRSTAPRACSSSRSAAGKNSAVRKSSTTATASDSAPAFARP